MLCRLAENTVTWQKNSISLRCGEGLCEGHFNCKSVSFDCGVIQGVILWWNTGDIHVDDGVNRVGLKINWGKGFLEGED